MTHADDIETTEPCHPASIRRKRDRQVRMLAEYPAAVDLAAAHGLSLARQHHPRTPADLGRYRLDLLPGSDRVLEVVLYEGSGRCDAGMLTRAQADALVARAGPHRRFESVVAFVRAAVDAVRVPASAVPPQHVCPVRGR